jgi:hypothetical protein
VLSVRQQAQQDLFQVASRSLDEHCFEGEKVVQFDLALSPRPVSDFQQIAEKRRQVDGSRFFALCLRKREKACNDVGGISRSCGNRAQLGRRRAVSMAQQDCFSVVRDRLEGRLEFVGHAGDQLAGCRKLFASEELFPEGLPLQQLHPDGKLIGKVLRRSLLVLTVVPHSVGVLKVQHSHQVILSKHRDEHGGAWKPRSSVPLEERAALSVRNCQQAPVPVATGDCLFNETHGILEQDRYGAQSPVLLESPERFRTSVVKVHPNSRHLHSFRENGLKHVEIV